MAQKVNFIGFYFSRRRRAEAKTRFRNIGMVTLTVGMFLCRERLS